jgi:hypothetical protein
MERNLKQGDIVFTPCEKSDKGFYLEERRVDEIGPDHIVLTHTANHYISGENLSREEYPKGQTHRGDRHVRDYYSRSIATIIEEFQRELGRFVQQVLKDEEKYDTGGSR